MIFCDYISWILFVLHIFYKGQCREMFFFHWYCTNNANKQHLSIFSQMETRENDVLICNRKVNTCLMHLIQLTLFKLDVKV